MIKTIERFFRMDEATWLRHCNPWSVYTRMATLPLLIMAIVSRMWIGWWSLIPVILLLLWIWINPRAFPPPKRTDNWASKCVFGERVWLNRSEVPIPTQHHRMAILLSLVSGAGLPFLAWGLTALSLWPTILGATLVYAGKLWFLDRMVWLYEDMRETTPKYAEWLKRGDA
jgi:hypothetical protein